MEEITSGTNLFLYLIYCFIDKNRYINKQIKWRHLYKYELLNGTCDPGQTSHCLKQNYSQVTQCHQDITQGFFFLALLCTSSKMMWLDSKSILPIRWWRYFTQTQYLICCDTVIIIKGNPLQKQTNKKNKTTILLASHTSLMIIPKFCTLHKLWNYLELLWFASFNTNTMDHFLVLWEKVLWFSSD